MSYLNATHAYSAFRIVDGFWAEKSTEPCVFIGTGKTRHISEEEKTTYRYVSVYPCAECNGALRGETFYTFEPLPAWGDF